ncbi:hypothetical protein [Butyrivibrio sp. MC2013]|uniref:hypothetical protein n=1 Tax=Butyrivibrio sp. MC2013 TaxID=1280686 RepID=UPI00041C6076|nr:hypothetical protein [Butyrivibrio sp. MC2013]
MYISVNIKQLGKKKNKISGMPFYLENRPSTVEQLIKECVKTCVCEYNERFDKGGAAGPITKEQIEAMREAGKIAFGINYGENRANTDSAINTALEAYSDGIYRIFLGMKELGQISEAIDIKEGDEVTFIRLVMLSGRLW